MIKRIHCLNGHKLCVYRTQFDNANDFTDIPAKDQKRNETRHYIHAVCKKVLQIYWTILVQICIFQAVRGYRQRFRVVAL